MAKKASSAQGTSGKALVIVESPAKARTIAKFLGNNYKVEASIGHVRDLPQSKKEVPEKYRDASWASLAVNVEDQFQPLYIVPAEKKSQVNKLKELLKGCDNLYLATDEDREGEAISWHLYEILNPKVPVHRLVFHEITKRAIDEAIAHPRQIDEGLVRAQETRRILDRLYGWEVSPLLWRKIGKGLSAGRVQSVAVRLIVQRERERRAFVAASYWDLIGQFLTTPGKRFDAELISVDGRRVPQGKDFDPANGQLKNPQLLLLDESQARQLADRLSSASYSVTALDEKPYTTKPAAPFTTSTLQQEANRKLGFTAKRTMSVAQSLYENGYITYMRTDSTTLAEEAVRAARELVRTEYGPDYLPATPRVYKAKEKNAQEAHEAIRPAGDPNSFRLPESLQRELNADQFKLYQMIWKRTIASQMTDAHGRSITVSIGGDGALFQVRGKTIEFPGFLRAYVEGSDDPEADLADKERILPPVKLGESLQCERLNPVGHTTKSPARYSEAALTQKLEELGIGRPSTYASIIETIQARNYVFKKGNALVPTWTAFSVARLLEDHLPMLVDYEFTAQMEDYLDAISRGEAEHVKYLRNFYFGEEQPGLKVRLAAKLQEIDARAMSQFELGAPASQPTIFLRVGRYGPFLEQGEPGSPEYRRAGVPDELAPDELTLEKATELLAHAGKVDEPLGTDPQSGRSVFLKTGRFGPYVQLGTADDESGEKPKNASLLRGMTPEEVSLEVALRLLELPRTVGVHPENNEPIVAHNGRYGPFIKWGAETRSLPDTLSPLEVTVEQALELLAQPKQGGRGRAAPREPLRTFDASPVTGKPVQLLAGRYGPYVTDGETNASLPKDADPGTFEFEAALNLLAERAARGPAPKKGRRGAKAASPKAAAPKKKAPAKKGATPRKKKS